ncbi:TB2/DP1, HVA22 family-domain-containing protein [Phlyctochytrium arcticum]|nr:TB2/DP1, HVA22 family-domain-containing protein [Phlyctochytrium arcticum]
MVDTTTNTTTPIPDPADFTLPLSALLIRTLTRASPPTQKAHPVLEPVVAALRTTVIPRVATVEHKAHSNPILIALWKKLGIPPMSIVVLAAAVALASVKKVSKGRPLLLTNLVGVLYPAYQSLKAVERPEPDDDERWLTYWTVFGFFSLLDSFSAQIKSYIKVYNIPKLLILYYLFARNGSLVLYRQAIRPFLVKYGGYGTVHAVQSTPVGSALVVEAESPLAKAT